MNNTGKMVSFDIKIKRHDNGHSSHILREKLKKKLALDSLELTHESLLNDSVKKKIALDYLELIHKEAIK